MASVSREADRLHKHLLTDLCDMMDPNSPTYKNFIRCLVSDILPLGRLSGVQQNPTDVFLLLEERGVLKVGEYQYLEEALEASRYINILDHLKNAEKHIARQMRKRCYSDGPVDGCLSNSEAATVSSIKPEGDQLCECKHVRCGTIEMKDLQDIQLLLIEAYERVQIISVSPVFETSVNLKDLNDFYTDVVIEEEREDSAQMKKGKQQINKKVTSFRQIFYKDDKKVTRIILKGPAGQGKSTFCRKLVHTWCSAQKKKFSLINDAISDEFATNDLKDENEILRFDILLYICLRDISDEKTLMDVVYNQFPLHESQDLSHRSHIEALIGQTVENKVLLIMDGLDEMANSSPFITKIMQKSLYPYLTVFASTRPWKIDQLGLIRFADSHLLLDLQGFSYENSMLFAKRLLNKCYKDKSVIEQFKKDISKNSVITSLIHVPLLLLFIVHVWYEKKSFPQTLHELYFEILNTVVNRYKECKERKQKCEGRQDERKGPSESMTFILTPKLRNLSLVQHYGEEFLAALCEQSKKISYPSPQGRQDERPSERMTFNLTHKLRNLLLVKDYGEEFLADLCEVAYHFLITDAEECSLVFEEKTLLELLGNIGLHAALDLGIFSKSELPGTFTKRICLTFLHKTVQEFLAAINICCREGKCNIFLDSLNTLNDVFKNEMIIKFVAGISTSHCEKISEKIYDLCDRDLDFDRALTMVKSDLCFVNYPRDLCRLYRDCIREACGKPISLKLNYLYVKNKEEWNVLLPVLRSKSGFQLSCFGNFFSQLTHISLEGLMLNGLTLTHISLRCCSIDDTKLDLSTCLVYLSLKKVTMKGKLLISKCTQLKCVTLNSCRLHDATMDLSDCTSLTEFSLQNMSMNIKLLLSKCTQLMCLKLIHCSLVDATLDLPECTSLTELSLVNFSMKGKLLLSRCTHIKCLNLVHCSLDDATLDLSDSASLTNPSLQDVKMKGTLLLPKCIPLKCLKLNRCNFVDATLDLSECTILKELSIQHVIMKDTLLLPKFTQLKCLKLNRCNFEDARLDLSGCTSLKELSIQHVIMKDTLLLPKFTQLKCLELNRCNFEDATLDLSGCTSLKELSIQHVIMKGTLLLPKFTQLKCLNLVKSNIDYAVLDLSESTTLSELCIQDMSLKSKLLLSKCTQLRCLKLVNCSLDDATLDLSECACLTEFSLQHVTMMGTLLLPKFTQLKCLNQIKSNIDDATMEFSDPFCLNQIIFTNVSMKGKLLLSRGYELKQLGHYSLDDATLDLSEYNNLTRLNLQNGTIKGKLLLSVSPHLKCLQLIKCRLDDVTVKLSESNCLANLCLDDVTMKGKLLLSKCTQLEHLKLFKCSLDDATLDLLESTRLTSLSLKDVTVKGKLLHSKCTQLEHLKLFKCSLDDATLDLLESTRLTSLSLEDVTVKGKLLLSKCTQLEFLKLAKCGLNDATLDFSESTSLTNLSLEGVMMKGTLLLPKFTQLKCLELNRCNFDDATLDLSESTRLTSLSLSDVTMKGKLLLSKYTKLEFLKLVNCSLNDTTLDLSESTRLTNLTLDNVTMSKECKEMLCNTLSHCRQVSFMNLDLSDAQLRLDKVNMLYNLDSEKMLFKRLSKHQWLTTLSIMNMDLDDTLLGLDLMKNLRHLNINNVTMCKDRYVMLCNSISKCTELTDLSLTNIDLGYALLKSIEQLDHLTINNVTMCKEGYVMLCNSISKCTTLRQLSLTNLDLADALISLDNLLNLWFITINNVTMCKDGYVILSKSMSKCPRLTHLSLMNLDLCDAMPCLDNLKGLELVNITISLQCVDRIKSSVQRMKLHHCYPYEGINKLVIERAADSFEKYIVNYTSKTFDEVKRWMSMEGLQLRMGITYLF